MVPVKLCKAKLKLFQLFFFGQKMVMVIKAIYSHFYENLYQRSNVGFWLRVHTLCREVEYIFLENLDEGSQTDVKQILYPYRALSS